MNKSTIHRIMFTILLLITQSSLFAMELAPFPPSNSSSEMCFLINNITPQYLVPEDIKKELLTLYIAMTDEERKRSSKYTCIESSDYMDLNKENKLYIVNFWCSNMISIRNVEKKQTIIFHSNDAPQHYAQMLKLPQQIRRQIAKKYFSTALVKTTGAHWLEPKDIRRKQNFENISKLNKFITPSTISSCLLSCPLSYLLGYNHALSCTMPMIIIGSFIFAGSFAIHAASLYKHPFERSQLKLYGYNGYVSQPLLPEDDNK